MRDNSRGQQRPKHSLVSPTGTFEGRRARARPAIPTRLEHEPDKIVLGDDQRRQEAKAMLAPEMAPGRSLIRHAPRSLLRHYRAIGHGKISSGSARSRRAAPSS